MSIQVLFSCIQKAIFKTNVKLNILNGSVYFDEYQLFVLFLLRYPIIYEHLIHVSITTPVQKNYNIKPDITTIGKIVGGGMPIGIIGISKKVYKQIKQKKIFYGGTFSGNSLSSFVVVPGGQVFEPYF